MNEKLRIVPLLLLLAISAALAFGMFRDKEADKIDKANMGKSFSYFEIPSLGSKSKFTPELFNGKNAIVVNVFASWCAPCALEHDVLMKLATHVPVYGIAWKDKPEDVLRYLAARGNPFQKIGIDEEGVTTLPMFISAVPETFILNHNGEIIFHYRSAIDDNILEKTILPIIRQLNIIEDMKNARPR